MRRPAPRALSAALESVVGDAAPVGLLPRVQAVWPEVGGPAVAEQTEPVGERGAVVTVHCRSAVWAHELALMEPDLRGRLNQLLGAPGVAELRFRAGPGARL